MNSEQLANFEAGINAYNQSRFPLIAISCVADNWGIGKKGKLLYRSSKDLRIFQRATSAHKGSVIVMGGTSYREIGKPLPNRTTLAITRRRMARQSGLVVANSFKEAEQLIEIARKTHPVWICGGEEIYKHFLAKCDYALITHAREKQRYKPQPDYVGADRFFPMEHLGDVLEEYPSEDDIGFRLDVKLYEVLKK